MKPGTFLGLGFLFSVCLSGVSRADVTAETPTVVTRPRENVTLDGSRRTEQPPPSGELFPVCVCTCLVKVSSGTWPFGTTTTQSYPVRVTPDQGRFCPTKYCSVDMHDGKPWVSGTIDRCTLDSRN